MSDLDSNWFNAEIIQGANLDEVLDAALLFEEYFRKYGILYKSYMYMSNNLFTIKYKIWELPQDNLEN